MLDALAPARRRLVLGALGLVLVALLLTGGLLLRDRLDQASPVPQGELGPVVLVTGYGGGTERLAPLADALEAEGRVAVVAPPVGRNTGDLDEQAESLARTVDKALADNDARTVDVIGYSAGGIVVRLWVKDHGGDQVARRVLTIGSPHHGAAVAELAIGLGACPRACRQLAPDSSLLRGLNAGDETPPGPQWTSVWSTEDQVATPPDTARLDGALELTVQSVCPDRRTSHLGLPSDPVVIALLDSALGTADPAPPTQVDC